MRIKITVKITMPMATAPLFQRSALRKREAVPIRGDSREKTVMSYLPTTSLSRKDAKAQRELNALAGEVREFVSAEVR